SLGILRPGIGVRATRGLMMMGCSMTPDTSYRVLPHNDDGVHVGNHCRSSWGNNSGRGTIGGPVGGVRPQPAGCTVTPETVGTVAVGSVSPRVGARSTRSHVQHDCNRGAGGSLRPLVPNTFLPLLAGHSGASHRAGGGLRTGRTPVRGGSLRGAGDTL